MRFVLVRAGMLQRKMGDVKHSSLPEQAVNLYKGSEHPDVLHQLNIQPDVRNKLWIVYSKGLRGNFFPAEFVHDVWLKHMNTKKASVRDLCVCANQILAKCTLEFGQLQDTVDVTQMKRCSICIWLVFLMLFFHSLFSSTTRFGSAARVIYLQATCLINLWLKGFNEAESAGWAFFWMI